MKNLILILLLSLCAGCAVQPVADPSLPAANAARFSEIRAVLQNGDWLVTRGVHDTDNFVATVTNMPLSHAAIYDAMADEVIEAEGVGVHATTLDDFLCKSARVLVIRPIWATSDNSPQAVAKARGWIGKGYNFTGLLGMNYPDRYYCTQLAVLAYKPFMAEKPGNPLPPVIMPGQMYHWGRIVFDSGP